MDHYYYQCCSGLCDSCSLRYCSLNLVHRDVLVMPAHTLQHLLHMVSNSALFFITFVVLFSLLYHKILWDIKGIQSIKFRVPNGYYINFICIKLYGYNKRACKLLLSCCDSVSSSFETYYISNWHSIFDLRGC